jgi:hypothetical protein
MYFAMKRWFPLLLFSIVIIAAIIGVVVVDEVSRPVDPKDIARLINRADKIVILQEPSDDSVVLFESSDRRDLDELKEAIRVERPTQFMHCECDGTPAIFLYAKGRKIGQITNHHGKLIRCNLWDSDAILMDTEAFLQWFDARNIPGPRKENPGELQRDKNWRVHEQKWTDAMPRALKPYWPEMRQGYILVVTPLQSDLAIEMGDKDARILALLAWFGSGAGPWSGFPLYEYVAEKMLLDYTTADLLVAIERKQLDVRQTEGAARLFGGQTFSLQRPDDLRLLPAELKARLLKHTLESSDQDKRSRAQQAFGEL